MRFKSHTTEVLDSHDRANRAIPCAIKSKKVCILEKKNFQTSPRDRNDNTARASFRRVPRHSLLQSVSSFAPAPFATAAETAAAARCLFGRDDATSFSLTRLRVMTGTHVARAGDELVVATRSCGESPSSSLPQHASSSPFLSFARFPWKNCRCTLYKPS